jgi:hypothetical protein
MSYMLTVTTAFMRGSILAALMTKLPVVEGEVQPTECLDRPGNGRLHLALLRDVAAEGDSAADAGARAGHKVMTGGRRWSPMMGKRRIRERHS